MWEYLGVEVPDDAHGVLQDVHWSGGHRLLLDVPARDGDVGADLGGGARDVADLEEQVGRGEFAALREWLGEHVHMLGRKYTSQEVLERATARRSQAQPYLDYLRAKYA